MKSVFAISLLLTLLSTMTAEQAGGSTVTAASSNESDVNAVINGPVHTAANGDIIQIPCSGAQSVVWTSTLSVSASITITALGSTPNTTPNTWGSGTNCLTIVDDNTAGAIFFLDPTYASSNNVTTLQNINIDPFSTTTALYNPITIEGTGNSAGMPRVRVDNMVFGNATHWGSNSSNAAQTMKVDNVIGVADHITIPSGNQIELSAVQMSSYLGVGQYGDNSWAQPDSYGSANNWFEENNDVTLSTLVVNDCTEGGPSVTESGGCRVVNRFNHVTGAGFYQLTGMHGLDTGGRIRSGRHTETYGNALDCTNACQDFASIRGGTGILWGNTGTGFYNSAFDMTTYRNVYSNNPFGYCGGLNSLDPFDTNDNTVYYSGTMTAGGLTMTDASKSFPSLTPTGAPYSVYDTTQGFVAEISSNTGTTITVQGPISESSWTGFNNGDAYEIIRSTVCMDQSGRGQGSYISGTTPTPSGAINQTLDPMYEWDDTGMNQQMIANTGRVIANRDYYTDNWKGGGLAGPTAQTGATAPFNGTNTCNAGSGNYACGVGFGTLANRPTTCTQGVAYWATDQGNWNQSGSGGQGQLFKCTAPNTWTLAYTPYTYPHPLESGSTSTTSSGPPPPSDLSGTLVN